MRNNFRGTSSAHVRAYSAGNKQRKPEYIAMLLATVIAQPLVEALKSNRASPRGETASPQLRGTAFWELPVAYLKIRHNPYTPFDKVNFL
jgi:hypothetical protein